MTRPAEFTLATLARDLKVPDVRRTLSIGCLVFAWLCANGALWNVVQVVGWVKMFHDYSATMSATQALEITFDGSAPCNLCHISQNAEEAARQQLPRDAELGGGLEKLLLASVDAVSLVLSAPDPLWPGVGEYAGLVRTEEVPVQPPRV